MISYHENGGGEADRRRLDVDTDQAGAVGLAISDDSADQPQHMGISLGRDEVVALAAQLMSWLHRAGGRP